MKKVTMYTGNPCSFCAAAKALLKTKNVEIEEIDIWADPANAKEMLQRTNGVRTIPQIFIGDHYIGCLLYTSPSPRDNLPSRMPSSA